MNEETTLAALRLNVELDRQAEFETQNILYSHKHDAYYNADTGAWVEKKCKDETCEFCSTRPETATRWLTSS